jgi:chemotaxis family two-component system response regulator Rcp1
MSGGPLVIMLVEDNPADVTLLSEALASQEVDSRLFVAHDGDEGIRILDAIDESRIPCPDLIVLDLNLPRRSGFSVLEHVRSSRKCNRKPVVVFSSSDAEEDREHARRLGASYYIRKPSTLKELMSIGAVLKKILAG